MARLSRFTWPHNEGGFDSSTEIGLTLDGQQVRIPFADLDGLMHLLVRIRG